MSENRRDFLKGAGASVAATLLLGESAKAAGHKENSVELPPWRYGTGSFAEDTVLMFRGNPTHTFYGTGPVPDAPKLKWKFRTSVIRNTVRGTPMIWTGTGWTGTAVKLGNYVFVGSVGGYVYAFEAISGKMIWKLRGGGMFKGSLCAYDNKLYIGNTDNLLRCIDAATGRTLWRHDTGRDLDSSPCVVDNRLYIAGENGYARCLSPQTGKLIWKTFMGGIGPGTRLGSNGSETSPAIADGDYYAVNYHGVMHCIDTKTGHIKWKTQTGDDTDASPVVSGDFIYAAAEEKSSYLFSFARADGREVWRYGGNKRGYWSTPAVVGDRIYVGGDDNKLHCVDAGSGKAVWTFQTGQAIWSSPCVVDGKVIFGSRDAHLYIIDAKTGTLIWKHRVDGRIISSPCVVDGTIWIGTATGWFYCFGK